MRPHTPLLKAIGLKDDKCLLHWKGRTYGRPARWEARSWRSGFDLLRRERVIERVLQPPVPVRVAGLQKLGRKGVDAGQERLVGHRPEGEPEGDRGDGNRKLAAEDPAQDPA